MGSRPRRLRKPFHQPRRRPVAPAPGPPAPSLAASCSLSPLPGLPIAPKRLRLRHPHPLEKRANTPTLLHSNQRPSLFSNLLLRPSLLFIILRLARPTVLWEFDVLFTLLSLFAIGLPGFLSPLASRSRLAFKGRLRPVDVTERTALRTTDDPIASPLASETNFPLLLIFAPRRITE